MQSKLGYKPRGRGSQEASKMPTDEVLWHRISERQMEAAKQPEFILPGTHKKVYPDFVGLASLDWESHLQGR